VQREAPGPWIHFTPHHFSIHCLPSIDQFGADNIREHLETLVSTPPRPNLQSVGAILKNPGNDWIDDDEVITTEWDEHVCPAIQPVAGDEFNIKTLSKPSGPLNAHLTIVLHYPTFVTDRILAASASTHLIILSPFCMVKSVQPQQSRFKTASWFNMSFRARSSGQTVSDFANWSDMEATFLELNRWVNKDSRILIMMGATNCSRRRLH
jgi:hypothetical protein